MFRFNYDHFYDDNPQDAVGGTNAPSVARRYSREGITGQLNHTAVISPELVNEARVAYLWGDPVTLWEAPNLTTTYTRAGNVPFTVGQSLLRPLQPPVPVRRHAHVDQGRPLLPLRDERRPPHVGRRRQRAGNRGPRHLHVPGEHDRSPGPAHDQRRPELHAADRLRDPQLRPQAVARRGLRPGQLAPASGPDRGRRPALRPPDADRRHDEPLAPCRLRLAPGRRRSHLGARRLRHVLHADPHQRGRELPGQRPRRPDDLHRRPRAVRISDLPDLRPHQLRPEGAAALAAPGARHHDPGRAAGLLPGAVRPVRAELRPAPELPRQARQSAQPGHLDRRRARARQGIAPGGRLRPPAPRRHRPLRGLKRPDSVRPDRARAGPERRRRQRDPPHSSGQRRRAPGQRAHEPRRGRVQRPADAASLPPPEVEAP